MSKPKISYAEYKQLLEDQFQESVQIVQSGGALLRSVKLFGSVTPTTAARLKAYAQFMGMTESKALGLALAVGLTALENDLKEQEEGGSE